MREHREPEHASRGEQRDRGEQVAEDVTPLARGESGCDERAHLVEHDRARQHDAGQQRDPQFEVERTGHGVVVQARVA